MPTEQLQQAAAGTQALAAAALLQREQAPAPTEQQQQRNQQTPSVVTPPAGPEGHPGRTRSRTAAARGTADSGDDADDGNGVAAACSDGEWVPAQPARRRQRR